MKRIVANGKWAVLVAALVCAAMLAGCGSSNYYKVRDTTTDKIYYTSEVDRNSNGSIRFKDENTGSRVTLQNSAVTSINKDEFKANTPKKK